MLTAAPLTSAGLILPAGHLLDSEDNELGRFDDGDTDFGDHLSGLAHLGRIGVRIAFDEERLLGGIAKKRPRAPLIEQEIADRPDDALPQGRPVGLKHNELSSLVNGLSQEIEETSRADVLEIPVRIAADGAPPRPGWRRSMTG